MPRHAAIIARNGVVVCCVAAGAAFLVAAGPALAAPVRIVWSTYLRVGPGQGYRVIDELRHDASVDLQACGPQWCKVVSAGVAGFVDKDAVALPRLPDGGGRRNTSAAACFIAPQDAWRGPAQTRFCETAPPKH